MIRYIAFYLIILCISMSGCASSRGQEKPLPPTDVFQSERVFQDYIPITPLEFDQPVQVFDDATKSFKLILIRELARDLPKVRAFLPNQSAYTAVQKLDGSGELKFGPASITAEAGTYNIYFDYCKFTTLKVARGDGTCPGFAKVGVGFRIKASITTFEAGVDVSSLVALSVAVKASKLAGQLSIDIIGIDSPKVTDLMTLPVDISQASIQNAFQSMATIKSRIFDNDVSLYPQVIAIKKSSGGCSLADIFNNTDPSKALKALF